MRRAALALARDVERRAPSIATSKWWKEERHGVFLDYNQNAKDRTVASAYSVRPTPDARVSFPLRWDEVPDVVMEDYTLATVPAIYAERGDAGAGIDDAVGSLEALLELSARHEAEGEGDAPWPPNYAKQEGEPPRVQPSRKREGRRPSTRAAARTAGRRRRSPRSAPPPSPPATRTPGCRPSGRARRPRPTGPAAKSSVPVIELGRAPTKAEVYEGLERWKARHPEAAAYLEPADVLETAMRGRAYAWYRLRLNLIHVPEEIRPPQEELDPDAAPDDWANLSDDERAAWMAGRAPTRRAAGTPRPNSRDDVTLDDRRRLTAFIDGYRRTFETFDVGAICGAFAFPVQVVGDAGEVGVVVAMPALEAWRPQVERIVGAYRLLGVTASPSSRSTSTR